MNKKYVYGSVIVVVVILGFLFWNQSRGGEEALNLDNIENGGKEENKIKQPVAPRPNTTTNKTETPKQPVSTIPTAAQLNGAIFQLKSYNGVPVDSQSRYTVSFDSEKLSAKFCNSVSGRYVAVSGTIKADNLIGTQMYCGEPQNLMEIETAFTTMLNFGAKISYTDSILILSDSKTIMMFTGFIN